MKKSFISYFILVLFSLNLYSSSYSWSSYISKDEVFVNEAVYLKYVCEFSDADQLYMIDFYPVSNEKYSLKLLKKTEKIINSKRVNTYEYIARVKSVGKTLFSFEVKMKKMSMESIVANTGSLDDDKYDDNYVQTLVELNTLSVDAMKPPNELFGRLKIDVFKDKATVKAYVPYHLDVRISGSANFNSIKPLSFSIDGVKVFAQKPITNIELNKDGYKGSWLQKFAFVSAEDYTIPAQSIEYFDTKSKSIKTLDINATKVKVQEVYKKLELLDKEEENFSFDIEYLYYLSCLIVGFLVGKIKLKPKVLNTKNSQLRDKIQNTKSMDSLSMILILNNHRKFNDILTSIDTQELTSLTQAKTKAIKLITDT